ncbi:MULTISPECIES: conjugal transfer system pilin TrbC [Pseudomonadota]|uniref:TrbC conjugal transfer protein n=2 Tax=Vibrionaceae TaxID=641 RepID=C5NND8_PHODP|nr:MULTISPECIES: conjugal transfer system pilin TrbC [Pseudomonadota]MBE4026203.1 conjugal transfer protein TrbC [Vibrio parahaemolyticus]AXQ85534.1 Conjugative transfer protein TrbC [Vibrio alginolyticus]MBU2866531.1 conjugal transfer system pilin TrbC [Pacificibacter marinus]MBU2956028.1 conjugal transfer system pilin TrbC [Marinobacter sp. F3R08]MCG6307749.1 conjugal transfer system pilin TrbC [Vibrio alginolyticus]
MQFSLSKIRFDRSSMFYLGLFALMFLAMALQPAMASEGTGGSLPYESWLTNLRNSVTGPVAFALSMIGIVVAGGILIFGGELNAFFRTLIFLVLVMAMLVGAQNMMSTFFGRGAELAALSEAVINQVGGAASRVVNGVQAA